jgi:hypothetical protein
MVAKKRARWKPPALRAEHVADSGTVVSARLARYARAAGQEPHSVKMWAFGA